MQENEQFEKNNEISLLDLVDVFTKNIIWIIISALFFGILAGVYVFVIANPRYQSRADVMVQVPVATTTDTGYDYVNAHRLISTIAQLMDRDIVLEEVIDALPQYDLSVENIRGRLTITTSANSFFITISFVATDSNLSRDVVNEVINAAIHISNTDPAFSSLSGKISRTSTAKDGLYHSPNKILFMAVGLILGAVFGYGAALMKVLSNNSFKTKEQLEGAFGIQVLGVVPKFDLEDKK